jgi:hypothetical protein
MRRLIVLLAAVTFTAGCGDDSAVDEDWGAFNVCTQFVEQRLKAPGTAKFRNFYQDDGEVTVTQAGDVFTVVSSVDSENGFGASLRTEFTCTVTSLGGGNWQLEGLDLR